MPPVLQGEYLVAGRPVGDSDAAEGADPRRRPGRWSGVMAAANIGIGGCDQSCSLTP
jgi:hypothetical protein